MAERSRGRFLDKEQSKTRPRRRSGRMMAAEKLHNGHRGGRRLQQGWAPNCVGPQCLWILSFSFSRTVWWLLLHHSPHFKRLVTEQESEVWELLAMHRHRGGGCLFQSPCSRTEAMRASRQQHPCLSSPIEDPLSSPHMGKGLEKVPKK